LPRTKRQCWRAITAQVHSWPVPPVLWDAGVGGQLPLRYTSFCPASWRLLAGVGGQLPLRCTGAMRWPNAY